MLLLCAGAMLPVGQVTPRYGTGNAVLLTVNAFFLAFRQLCPVRSPSAKNRNVCAVLAVLLVPNSGVNQHQDARDGEPHPWQRASRSQAAGDKPAPLPT